MKLQGLLRTDPALAADLRRVVDQVLTPALTAAGQARIAVILMTGSSHDSSTFTQIATQIVQPPAPPPLEVRYSLPPDTAAFTGRDEELHRITAVADAAGTGGVVAVHAIDGMPGVGQTALAVHAAHLLRHRFRVSFPFRAGCVLLPPRHRGRS